MNTFNFETDSLNPDEYVYLGYQEGNFVTEDGRSVPYKNIFVFNEQANSYKRSIFGYVSQKLKITNTLICKDLKFGQIIHLFFDQYGRVTQIIPA